VSEVLNERSMEEAFGVKVAVTDDSQTGAVYYLPQKPPP